MTETNIKIIGFEDRLYFNTKRIILRGENLSHDLVQKVCSKFSKQYKLAAVPHKIDGRIEILVISEENIKPLILKDDNWFIEASDSGEKYRLTFSNIDHRDKMAELLKRCLIIQIKKKTDLWNISSESPSIFYQKEPFKTIEDIKAYRRIGISIFPIDGVGLAVSADISTAFFTNLSIADYFLNGRINRFKFLSQRQHEQTGTLLYDLNEYRGKCYFEEFVTGITCNSTSGFRVNGEEYSSLYEYYKRKHPKVEIKPNSPVARVSFKNLDKPKPVAANKLYLRVMNEALPGILKQVDKVPPNERKKLLESFWRKLGDKPFGYDNLNVMRGFWHPKNENIILLQPPELEFAQNQRIKPPEEATVAAYQKYFNLRKHLLSKSGAFYVPKTLTRKIYFGIPNKSSEDMREKLAEGITDKISKWTRIDNIDYELEPYSTFEEGINKFRKKYNPGMVVFVFDEDDPANYFNIAYNLENWRIKRITYCELNDHFNKYINSMNQSDNNEKVAKPVSRWNSFIEMSALDVLQQLGCIPWTISSPLDYDAQLVIDVSHDRRYFGLSLLICRDKLKSPSFWIDTITEPKPDTNHETINEIVLRDKILEIFNRARLRDFEPLSSLLILRDGRKCGREIEGILRAETQLQNLGLLTGNSRLDIVDFHKSSQKRIRMWKKNTNNTDNVLEGTGIMLDKNTVVLANTGSATLHQKGTVEPVMLIGRNKNVNILTVAKYVFATAQLNWSSPRVAQRLSLPAKCIDDHLKLRLSQDIKRIK